MREYYKRIAVYEAGDAPRIAAQLCLARRQGAALSLGEPKEKNGKIAIPLFLCNEGWQGIDSEHDVNRIVEKCLDAYLSEASELSVRNCDQDTLEKLMDLEFVDSDHPRKKIFESDDLLPEEAGRLDEENPMDAFNVLAGQPALGDFRKLLNVLQIRGAGALETTSLVFEGAPGTGKSTAAEAWYYALKNAGMIKGRFVSTTGASLLGKYSGHTASKVEALFREAVGGVIFIDEAYALLSEVKGDDHEGFGQEAVDTLVSQMERARSSTSVVIAGYAEELELLYKTNPGLRGRFLKTIEFKGYNADALVAICLKFFDKKGIEVSESARAALKASFDCYRRAEGFANGRTARTIADLADVEYCTRLAEGRDGVREISEQDIVAAFEALDLEKPSQGVSVGFR